VQEKDDVADPGVQLEIIWRQMEFAKNLNQYFNSVSLAGITAGETAIRVQVHASLAELALLALDQYAKIEQMEKDAKEKLHSTWAVMKEYVRDQ
jgi:flagellar hook-associated protein FlgK